VSSASYRTSLCAASTLRSACHRKPAGSPAKQYGALQTCLDRRLRRSSLQLREELVDAAADFLAYLAHGLDGLTLRIR